MQMCCELMARIMFLFIILCCFIVHCFSVQLRLFKDNYRMPNASIIENAYSLMECAARFVNDESSLTFNFHEDDNICEFSVRCPEENSLQSNGWRWYSAIDSKYYVSNAAATWDDAKTACENMSARLVIIDDESEQTLLQGIIGAAQSHWIGLQCSVTVTPNCTWIDGRPMEGGYTNWYPGEPVGRKCVWMGYGGYMWDDNFCNIPYNFICEYL